MPKSRSKTLDPTTLDPKQSSRRKAAKQLLIGGGLVGAIASKDEEWVKPILKESVLPVHAKLSSTPWG